MSKEARVVVKDNTVVVSLHWPIGGTGGGGTGGLVVVVVAQKSRRSWAGERKVVLLIDLKKRE
jgi:hypothetical protein